MTKPRPIELIIWGLVIAIIGSGVFAWLRVSEIQNIAVISGYCLIIAGLIAWGIGKIKRRQ